MWVKFTGQGELSFEYNGRRFHFTKNSPPVEIDSEIYDYVKSARTVESEQLKPCEAPTSGAAAVNAKALEEKIKFLEAENANLKKKIAELETDKKGKTKK